jgi:transcriptional antiterminator RfaH
MDWIGTLAAFLSINFGTMSAYQHEAARASALYPSLPEGASRRSGYARRDHRLVGVGTGDQTLAAAGPQFSGGFSGKRLSREAEDGRRTRLLSCQSGAPNAAGKFTEMNRDSKMNSSDPFAKSIDLWNDIHWFAIRAKPRRESFAAMNIGALSIGILLPQVKVERLVRGAAHQGTKPLFAGYFFARFSAADCLESVKAARGVLQVVSSGRMPIPVSDEVVLEIQARIQDDGFIRIRSEGLAPGTRVTIQSGPFEGMMGRVERELDDQKRVAIFLETLMNARVLIEKRWIAAEAA